MNRINRLTEALLVPSELPSYEEMQNQYIALLKRHRSLQEKHLSTLREVKELIELIQGVQNGNQNPVF
jgi:hypothetical protein